MITRMINIASRQPKNSTMRYRSHVRYLGTMIRHSTTGTVRLYCGVRLSSARNPSQQVQARVARHTRVGKSGRRATVNPVESHTYQDDEDDARREVPVGREAPCKINVGEGVIVWNG
jgi:hypothetical protein